MSRSKDAVAGASQGVSALLRTLPSVDDLLAEPPVIALMEEAGPEMVTHAARKVLEELRAELKINAIGGPIGIDGVAVRVAAAVEAALAPSLRRVINATGVILHTNLGRAPLSPEAAAAIAETASRYTNLEY